MEDIKVVQEVKPNNIYKKLQNARVKMQEHALKKNAENKFAKYSYFTLDALLPAFNKCLNDEGLFSQFQVTEQIAMLTIIDVDDPSKEILFSMPSVEVELKGATLIQSIGARNTYLMRYLLMTAMQVSESSDDIIDSTEQSELNSKPSKKESKKTEHKEEGETLESVKQQVKEKCTELAKKDRSKVNETVLKYHTTPNPSGIKDIEVLKKLLEELNTL